MKSFFVNISNDTPKLILTEKYTTLNLNLHIKNIILQTIEMNHISVTKYYIFLEIIIIAKKIRRRYRRIFVYKLDTNFY